MSYDTNNIFAKILRGEMPAVRVYEDEHVLAFMDVFPQSKGHCLVISKTATARNLLDADTLDSVMAVLDELRDGGRVVGIVSHVDEMRQRIPSRLHVIRGRAGSSVKVIAG